MKFYLVCDDEQIEYLGNTFNTSGYPKQIIVPRQEDVVIHRKQDFNYVKDKGYKLLHRTFLVLNTTFNFEIGEAHIHMRLIKEGTSWYKPR